MPGAGWTVALDKSLTTKQPWIGRAWDPNEKKYRSKRHTTKGQANRWAKDESQRLAQGLSQAGQSFCEDLLDEYIKDRNRKGGRKAYVDEVRRVLASAIAAGVSDLRHPRALQHATDWLDKVRSVHPTRKDRPLAPKTLNRYLETLQTFANFALERGRILKNPFLAIDAVRVPDKIKPTFKIDELRKLCDPAHKGEPFFLLFQLLIYTGCRMGEAAHLKWENIDWTEGRINVRMDHNYDLKGQKERFVPLQPELAETLREAKPEPAEGYIIPDAMRAVSNGRHCRRLQAYMEACGVLVTPRRTPHSTRHTWICLMLATGENHYLVQLYAGHSENDTTAGYAKMQALYRDAVKDWERGRLKFRP